MKVKSAKFAYVCVISLTIWLILSVTQVSYQKDNNKSDRESSPRFLPKTNYKVIYPQDESAIPSEVYQQRMAQVHKVCAEENINTDDTLNTYLSYSKTYRLACDIIPKIGSTSLLNVFSILNDSNSDTSNESRKALHRHSRKLVDMKSFKIKKLANYTVLFPSRDPYTRLYSAFIDKIFIFNSMELTNSVANHTGGGKWLHNVTFQMFLDYALDKPDSRKHIGDHFKAIFIRNTWLCSLQKFIVIKQETFSRDLEYTLKEVNVENDKMEAIHGTLSSRRVEISVAEIVKTVMPRLRYLARKVGYFEKFATKKEAQIFVIGRLWNSFRIQGFINAKSRFPVEKFLASDRSDFDADFVLKIVLEEIRRHPLNHSESKEQRHHIMKVAYGDIKEDTVKRIQEVYKLDFKAFGYNTKRPY